MTNTGKQSNSGNLAGALFEVSREIRAGNVGMAAGLLSKISSELDPEGQILKAEHDVIENIGSFFSMSPLREESIIGRRVADRYSVIEIVGKGGMGTVYRAFDERLHRDVALKVLRDDANASFVLDGRFESEAKTLASLDHPSIVTVHDFGDLDGSPFFVMEFVHGPSMAELLRAGDKYEVDEALPPRRGREWYRWCVLRVADIASALGYCHRRGLEHSDVKPGNLIVAPDRKLRLVDFGIARDRRDQSAARFGTVRYLTPEALDGRETRFGHVDVWALGVTLYEMLVEVSPWEADTEEELLRTMNEGEARQAHAVHSGFPVALSRILGKVLARRREDRYQAIEDFEEDLRRWLANRPMAASSSGIRSALKQNILEHRRRYGLIALSGLLLFLLLISFDYWKTRADWRRRMNSLPSVEEDDAYLMNDEAIRALSTMSSWLELPGATEEERETLGRRAAGIRAAAWRRVDALEARIVNATERPASSIHELKSRSDVELLRSTQELASALRVVDQGTLSQAWDRSLPCLRVTGAADLDVKGLYVFELEVATGLLKDATYYPWADAQNAIRLPAGNYRVRAVTRTGMSAEFSRHLRGEIVIDLETRHFQRSTSDMVLVDAPAAKFGDSTDSSGPYRERKITVPPFYIDRFEVTCEDYEKFRRQHQDVPAPKSWRGQPYQEEWARLPVVGVSWANARLFAEWGGKRLPSLAEWHLAARGPELAAYPWGDEPGQPKIRASIGRKGNWIVGSEEVGSHPNDKSRFGMFDAYGSAIEWTDTPLVFFADGYSWEVNAFRSVAGFDWRSTQESDLNWFSHFPPNSTSAGFRCAVSVFEED